METSPENKVTFKYSETTAKRLAEMQSELGLSSVLDIIKLSVKVLSFLLRERSAGWQLVLRKDGIEKDWTPVEDKAASDEVDAIHEEFETEFKSIDKFGITGTAIGHPVGDFPTIRVYVLSEGAKQQLTKELRMRDHSQDFLIYKGARIQIVVTGHIV